MIATSLYEHPSTSTAGFPSSGQSLQSLQQRLREHRTLSTHLGYIWKYTVIEKIKIFATLQIDPTWNSARTRDVRTLEGLALRPQPAPNQTAMFQGAQG